MSGDPAIDAAHKAIVFQPYPNQYLTGSTLATFAAREALKPIRALHSPGEKCTCCWGHYEDGSPVPKRRMCMACGVHWPCATAKLAFTSEELES